MKIILTAFDKLQSAPMDVPENTTPTFRLALTQPITARVDFEGRESGKIPPSPIDTICEFEWTGKIDSLTGARIYVLTGISK